MDKLNKIKKMVDKFLEWLCILMLAVMTVLVVYQVVTRYVFKSPSRFSEAAAQYLFVWLVMFASALVFGARDHLEISVIKDKFKPKTRFTVDVLINVCLLVFSLTVCIYGGFTGVFRQIATVDPSLGIPVGVIYFSIPFSGIFMAFYAIFNCFLAYKEYKEKLKLA